MSESIGVPSINIVNSFVNPCETVFQVQTGETISGCDYDYAGCVRAQTSVSELVLQHTRPVGKHKEQT